MKDNTRYKIDTFLKMATITASEKKKEDYLLMAEELLNFEPTFDYAGFGDVGEMEVVSEFIDKLGVENIEGRPTAEIYSKYLKFCESIEHIPVNKAYFSKYMTHCDDCSFYTQPIYRDGKSQRVFKSRGE